MYEFQGRVITSAGEFWELLERYFEPVSEKSVEKALRWCKELPGDVVADGEADEELKSALEEWSRVHRENQETLHELCCKVNAEPKPTTSSAAVESTLKEYAKLVQKDRKGKGRGAAKIDMFLDDEVVSVSDEDVLCCVCAEGDQTEENMILFCDGCNLAVHQLCYGVGNIPEGSWFCDRCTARDFSARCCICNSANGALKPAEIATELASLPGRMWCVPITFLSSTSKMLTS